MRKFEFSIFCEPKGKGRPRFNSWTGRAYTPKDTREYEEFIRQEFLSGYPKAKAIETPIRISIVAYHGIPKSYSARRAEDCFNGTEKPAKKPDVDNIAKAVLDALNGIAFLDDKQVIAMRVLKAWHYVGHTDVVIEEV